MFANLQVQGAFLRPRKEEAWRQQTEIINSQIKHKTDIKNSSIKALMHSQGTPTSGICTQKFNNVNEIFMWIVCGESKMWVELRFFALRGSRMNFRNGKKGKRSFNSCNNSSFHFRRDFFYYGDYRKIYLDKLKSILQMDWFSRELIECWRVIDWQSEFHFLKLLKAFKLAVAVFFALNK